MWLPPHLIFFLILRCQFAGGGRSLPRKSTPSRAAAFIEPMECLPAPHVPEGAERTYEIKLDGYRLEAVRIGAKTILYSRRQNVLNGKFP